MELRTTCTTSGRFPTIQRLRPKVEYQQMGEKYRVRVYPALDRNMQSIKKKAKVFYQYMYSHFSIPFICSILYRLADVKSK
jgi:hypothetical protein